MEAREGDKLWPKRGKFYHHGRVETVVCGGGMFTSQKLSNSVKGAERPGAMPGADRDLPCGIPKRLY